MNFKPIILGSGFVLLLLSALSFQLASAQDSDKDSAANNPETKVEKENKEAPKKDQAASEKKVDEKKPAVDDKQKEELVPESKPPQTFSRTDALVASITIFVLAIFIGFELITKVPPTLHTPLMSGSNAISGISIVGALFAASKDASMIAAFFGFIAVVMATLNVVGGYWVTHRMLDMFKSKK